MILTLTKQDFRRKKNNTKHTHTKNKKNPKPKPHQNKTTQKKQNKGEKKAYISRSGRRKLLGLKQSSACIRKLQLKLETSRIHVRAYME